MEFAGKVRLGLVVTCSHRRTSPFPSKFFISILPSHTQSSTSSSSQSPSPSPSLDANRAIPPPAPKTKPPSPLKPPKPKVKAEKTSQAPVSSSSSKKLRAEAIPDDVSIIDVDKFEDSDLEVPKQKKKSARATIAYVDVTRPGSGLRPTEGSAKRRKTDGGTSSTRICCAT